MFRTLRFKILLILLGGALIAAGTGLALIFGIARADNVIDRTHLSQRQLELLLLLSGRINDYGLIAIEAARVPQNGRGQLASAVSEVNAVFDLIEASIQKQVAAHVTDSAGTAESREGLGVARMRAMFRSLDAQIVLAFDQAVSSEDRQTMARQRLDVFGVGFAPLLSQTIESERAKAQNARAEMTLLRSTLVTIALVLSLGGLALASLLYFGPVRSVLSRLSHTVAGAEAIASGKLDTRLAVEGRDELTGLMESFNRMAESLAAREGALVAAKLNLEATVEARTVELRDANTRLEDIDANRRRFFADISHELRTPLTVILGESELLLRRRDLIPAPAAAAVETIQARARRLSRRIEDMLRVARSESGRLELNVSRAEAGEVLSDAVDDVVSVARHSGIDVKLERGPGNLFVRGDKDWLRQLCSGLIVNAIKYSSAPGMVCVRASLEVGSDQVAIEISDQGQGIAQGEQTLVFDRFYRGKAPTARAAAGHGVGLALAKWIIDEHKGKIEIESPGRLASADGSRPGTTLIVRLSLAERAGASKAVQATEA